MIRDGTNSSWFASTGWKRRNSAMGCPAEATRQRGLRRITAEQVRAAFLKWVRPADFVQVTLGPEGK